MHDATILRLGPGAGAAASGHSHSLSEAPSTSPTASTTGGTSLGSTGTQALRMLKLLDRKTGVCVFTLQWKWNPHAHAEGVDALVQTFAQFAREIDGGDVVRVQFDATSSRGSLASLGNGSIDDERRLSVSSQSTSAGIEMLSHDHEVLQGVLFHDRVADAVTVRLRTLLELAVDRFYHLHADELERIRPNLTPAISIEQVNELTAPFEQFTDVLEKELLPGLVA